MFIIVNVKTHNNQQNKVKIEAVRYGQLDRVPLMK